VTAGNHPSNDRQEDCQRRLPADYPAYMRVHNGPQLKTVRVYPSLIQESIVAAHKVDIFLHS
jgi:hypothetical protein